ncbi:MAG: class I SAM-dependent methyltransferase [Proteobacteria bacterium]|nr:class I SAM-dependent methyltransferase [Pseudomonadota bacterium]
MEKISNIPEFLVTNRKFIDICKLVNLKNKNIIELPEHANVLEVGSGLTQEFARGIKSLRPDIQAFSIDPTLALGEDDLFDAKITKNFWRRPTSVLYSNKNLNSGYPDYEKGKNIDPLKLKKYRIKEANKTGNTVASLVPEIAFQDNSFDLLIDVYGPGMYLQVNSPEEFGKYLEEIYRVLRPGGEARIFPAVDFKLAQMEDLINENELLDKSKNYFELLIKERNLNFQIEFVIIRDSKTQEGVYTIILKK